MLCPNCHLPETKLKVKGKKLYHKCAACGSQSEIDSVNKMSSTVSCLPARHVHHEGHPVGGVQVKEVKEVGERREEEEEEQRGGQGEEAQARRQAEAQAQRQEVLDVLLL